MATVKYPQFLTDENLSFVQKLCAGIQMDAVCINIYTKDHVIFYLHGQNAEVAHNDLQQVEWSDGLKVYKVLNHGEPIPIKNMSQYRAEKMEKIK